MKQLELIPDEDNIIIVLRIKIPVREFMNIVEGVYKYCCSYTGIKIDETKRLN